METSNFQFKRKHHPAGRVLGGLVLIGVGAVLFADRLGAPIPEFVFTWKMALIALGIYLGAKSLFTGLKWLIPMFIGAVFLLEDLIPSFSLHSYFWPIFFLFFGVMMVFRPRKYCHSKFKYYKGRKNSFQPDVNAEATTNDPSQTYTPYPEYGAASSRFKDAGERLNCVVIFGGDKRTLISKNFKGGEITCVFGGAEINLMQADFIGTVQIEFNQVFGGTKLLIPSNWKVKSELSSILGGFEDKRPNTYPDEEEKILILKGENIFGGVEIKSK